MIDIVSLNSEYYINDNLIKVVGLNEIVPNDKMYQMINKNHPERVMPLVEYIDSSGNWHVCSLEDFIENAKEI